MISRMLYIHLYEYKFGRSQKAFSDLSSATIHQYRDQHLKVCKQRLFNQNINPDFLSYERRQDSKVRVLKKIVYKPSLDERISQGGMPDSFDAWQSNPIRRYTFNWKQPKEKITMNPVLTAVSDAGGDASYGPGS